MEKTVEVTSIPFTDKEYVKALETLLNQSIDFIAEKLDEKLISDGYISLQNNLVINMNNLEGKVEAQIQKIENLIEAKENSSCMNLIVKNKILRMA